MALVPDFITRPAVQLGKAAQNALEVARFGGLDTGEQPSPFAVVTEQRMYRLRRYFPPGDDADPAAGRDGRAGRAARAADHGPPVLLVPPLMLAADVYDVSPSASGVGVLRANGADPWVVDFGAPEHQEGGLERTLADHVLAVSQAIDQVCEATGRDVHLGGYSQGGMFCYQAAAYRRSAQIKSIITFGSPVDTRGALPLGIPEDIAVIAANVLAAVLEGHALPAWASRTGFRLLDPVKSLRQRLDFVLALHDRDALLPRERQRRFLMEGGWVAWPGPALAEFMLQFIAHNRMLEGGFLVDDRLVTLADISNPMLCVVGEVDEIAPPRAVRAIGRAAPSADIYELSLSAGHFGLVVGSLASRASWPVVARWARWCDGDGELPAQITRPPADGEALVPAGGTRARVATGVELATGVGIGIARSLSAGATETVRSVRVLGEEAVRQLPRLARLERVQPHTRVSLGLLLDEQAKRAPQDAAFLFEDRVYTQAAVKQRIDNVVRGLLSLGVRQGEHVGVLMGTRPSALVVVAALNRLGAVVVALRPDGAVAIELALGQVRRVVADPELADRARRAGAAQVFVLGGGGDPRDLGADVVDMERIDPDTVRPPAWYRPNPGRARDLAFLLFTGEGERTSVNRITHGRWALSAFGTATSADLTPADTVYSLTPIHHPSALLMSIGGAVAGGARFALARHFDPATFWAEVRRYGVTVASYTWTMLRDLVEAPPQPGERHHSIRLFMGSGMPPGLWRRVTRRFEPARVLEFYASTEGEAVLVNLSGLKAGAKGRPLPGSAEVRIAGYDAVAGRLDAGADGFAREVSQEQTGMLLARVRGELVTPGDSPLRGVFERDDAWLSTGDLFRRDADGDHWLVDHAHALISTAAGTVASLPIADALGELDAVDLAVAYGVPAAVAAAASTSGADGAVAAAGARRPAEIAVAAVTLRAGRKLAAADLSGALAGLSERELPTIVHVVAKIPLTTWYRPLTAPLRAAGIPRAGRRAWLLQAGEYVPFTAARRARLGDPEPII